MSLTDLLGTDDPAEQEQRVTELLQFAQSPPMAVLVSFIPSVGDQPEQIVVTPTLPIGYEAAEQLLLAGLRRLRQQEREELRTQTSPQVATGKTIRLGEEQPV